MEISSKESQLLMSTYYEFSVENITVVPWYNSGEENIIKPSHLSLLFNICINDANEVTFNI